MPRGSTHPLAGNVPCDLRNQGAPSVCGETEDAPPRACSPQPAERGPQARASRMAERSRRRSGPRSRAWGLALLLAAEEARWVALVDCLPKSARELWGALKDMRQFWRMLQEFGGQSLRIPRAMPGKRSQRLRRALGVRCLAKLIDAFGGTRVYVPRCAALRSRLRHEAILGSFARAVRCGSGTAAVEGLSRRYAMTGRHIWNILKKEASAPAQARLLYHLSDSGDGQPRKHSNMPK